MGLLDFFRPKHKHSRVEVRLDAVRQLGEDEISTLTDIARTDPDKKIREVALRKLTDPALLTELAGDERDDGLKAVILRRASELSVRRALDAQDDGDAVAAVARISEPKLLVDVIRRARSDAARRRALMRLEEPRALAEVAQKSDDPQLRADAVARISEPKVLRDLAINEATRSIQLLAIERLEDAVALRVVSEKGKSKAVRAAAKDKLVALGAFDDDATTREHKPKKPADPAAEARLKQRKIEVEMRRRAEEDRKTAVQDKKARLEAEHAERLARLEAEEAAAKTANAAKAEQKRTGDELVDELAKNAGERPRREETPEEKERRAARDAEKAARAGEKQRKQEEKDAQAKENVLALESLTARIEAMATAEDPKDAGALLKEAQGSQAARGPLPPESTALRERFDEARTKLASRVNELRETEDWRRFANVPKLEALITRAESLAKVVIGAIKLEEGQELDASKVSRELRAMQGEWKTIGRPPREKADQMWERFKAATDIIYEGNKKGMEGLDEERVANLKMKEELCDKVEALIASAEAGSAKAISDQIKTMQEDWKKIGPVPRSENERVWQRFRGACDKFFESRKQSYEKVDADRGATLEKQLVLVSKAEALRDSQDWKGTADKLKDLQEQWKQLGPGKKPESDDAWKKLRAACDLFFERRKAHFGEQDEERGKNLEKKEALVAEAVKLAAGDEVLDPDAKIRELMTEWKKIGPVAKDKGDEIWARFGKALDALRSPAAPPPEVVAAASGGNWANTSLADKLKPVVAPESEEEKAAKAQAEAAAKAQAKAEVAAARAEAAAKAEAAAANAEASAKAEAAKAEAAKAEAAKAEAAKAEAAKAEAAKAEAAKAEAAKAEAAKAEAAKAEAAKAEAAKAEAAKAEAAKAEAAKAEAAKAEAAKAEAAKAEAAKAEAAKAEAAKAEAAKAEVAKAEAAKAEAAKAEVAKAEAATAETAKAVHASPSPIPSPTPSPSPSPSPSPTPSLSPSPSPSPTPSLSPTSPPEAAAPNQDAWPATEDWTLPDDPSKT